MPQQLNRKQIASLLFFFTLLLSNAQELILPTKRVTFGSKLHTNRDVLVTSIKDSSNDFYLIGTTEDDITFNDIEIVKLNANLGEIWRKTISFETDFSYDRVVDSYLDSQDNLVLLCKSAYSKADEIFVILKLDKSGNVIWELPTSNYSNPVAINTFLYHSFLDENDVLHLAYVNKTVSLNQNKIEFIEISSDGFILKEFDTTDIFETTNPIVKIDYNNGYYYMFSRDYIDVAPYYEFYYYKYNGTDLIKTKVDIPEETMSYISNSFSESYSSIVANKDGGLLLVAPEYLQYKGYSLLSLNDDGSIKYLNEPDLTYDKYIIGYYIVDNGSLVVVSNDKVAGSTDSLVFSMQKYDANGEVSNSASNTNQLGRVPYFKDSYFGLYTESNKVLKYNYNFEIQQETQLNPINANYFEPSSIHFINEETFLGGTNQSFGYEGSDFLSEEDWSFKKMNSFSEIDVFEFSGEGTSKAYQKKSIQKDADGNYIVAITEKTGPDNLSIGGSRGGELSHILKYSNNLELLEKQTDVYNDIWIDKPDDRWSFNLNSEEYEYQYNHTSLEIRLVKKNDNELIWSRFFGGNLDTPRDFNIDSNGALIIKTNYSGSHSPAINKITFDNEFSRIELDRNPVRIIMLDNDWIFTVTDVSNRVYTNDLSLISEHPIEGDYENPNYAAMLQKNNKVMVHTLYDQQLNIYNQYGELENTFILEEDLRERYAFFEGNDLVVLGEIGKFIIREYSWLRAAISKYENFVINYLGETSYGDLDGDGINDFIDRCPNTPPGDIVDEFGCISIELTDTDFNIIGKTESCPSSNNGSIEVITAQNYEYTAVLMMEGVEISTIQFSENGIFSDLAAGTYDVCITVGGFSEFEQCSQIIINALEKLFVNSKVDTNSNKLFLTLSGAKEYFITLNDKTITTSESEITLELYKDVNNVIVSTDKECQGVFEKLIISNSEILVYPNPILSGKLNILTGNIKLGKIETLLFDVNGKQIFSKIFNNTNELLQLNMETIPQGIYVLTLRSNKIYRTFKIIKK